jgi:ATP-binding cassette, subfamily B, bacterial
VTDSSLSWAEVRLARLDAKKPLRRLPILVGEAARLLWRTSPGWFVFTAILQVLLATGLATQLLAGRDLLDAVLTAADRGDDLADLREPLLVFAAITIVLHLMRAIERTSVERLRLLVSHAALDEVLDVATSVDLEAFETPAFFDRLQRAKMSARDRPWATVSALIGLLSSLLGFFALGSVLAQLHAGLLPFVVVATIPGLVVARRMTKARFRLHLQLQQDQRREAYLVNVLTSRSAAKEVRSFASAGWLRARHDALADHRISEQLKISRKSAREHLVASGLGALATGGGFLILLWLVVDGQLDAAGAAAAAYAMQRIQGWLAGAAGSVNSLYDGALFLDDYAAFVDAGRQTSARRPPRRDVPPFAVLRAQGITFTYPGSEIPAVADIDLDIRAGQVVALVGENGSGKTTLAKMLCGLYTPTAGSITWDGVDTRLLPPDDLRSSIAVIFQDFARYDLTAAENIGIGRIDRFVGALGDAEAIAEAARAVGADRFLEKLPRSYETLLAKDLSEGTDLSVGQWQRVALARAFFRDAAFLVLDEPTAALDPRAEHALFERMRHVTAGRTVLMISHRLHSVRNADRILVLDAGRLIEQGTHDELMALGGSYAEMFTLQSAAYRDTAATPS